MKYSMKEKLKIVKEHLEDGVPLHELAKKYNYHYTNIKYQCALYRMYGEKAFEDHLKPMSEEALHSAARRIVDIIIEEQRKELEELKNQEKINVNDK